MKFILPHEPLPERNLIALIYGDPGVAKTSLAMTSNSPILFDFDDGVERAHGRVAVLKPDSWQEFLDFIDGKSEYGDVIKEHNIETLICDTAEELLNFVAAFVKNANIKNKRNDGALSLQGYGVVKSQFQEVLKQKLKKKGVDLIIVAHATGEKEGDNIRYVPKVTGGSYDILLGASDLVGYMEISGGQNTLDFNPTDRHFGKNAPSFDKFVLPHFNDNDWKGFFGRIIRKTKDHFNKISDEQQDVLQAMDDWSDKLKAQTKLGLLEKLMEDIQSIEKTGVKKQVLAMYNDRYKEIITDTVTQMKTLKDVDSMIKEFENFNEYQLKAYGNILAIRTGEILSDHLYETISSAESLNEYMVKELVNYPDYIKTVLKKAVSAFANDVGFKLNKAEKKYEDTDKSLMHFDSPPETVESKESEPNTEDPGPPEEIKQEKPDTKKKDPKTVDELKEQNLGAPSRKPKKASLFNEDEE